MHKPGHIRDAFYDLVMDGATGVEFYDRRKQMQFEVMSTDEKLQWLSGQLWHCTDIMPSELREELCGGEYSDAFEDETFTYAQAVQGIRKFERMPLLGA